MSPGFWIFFIIICILGFSYMKTGTYFGFLTGKNKKKDRQQADGQAAAPPVTLDAQEIRKLGESAAEWCSSWVSSSKADHKWLVIEVSNKLMDCRGVTTVSPYNNYPHCTVNFSKEIDWSSTGPIAQEILSIISARCPKMVSSYGLYKDGHSLILPTNWD